MQSELTPSAAKRRRGSAHKQSMAFTSQVCEGRSGYWRVCVRLAFAGICLRCGVDIITREDFLSISLIDTTRGKHWLNNFVHPAERDIASRLLSALELISNQLLEAGVRTVIEELAAKRIHKRPLALFAAREISTGELETLPGHNYFGCLCKDEGHLCAADSSSCIKKRKYKPRAVGPGSNIGSEGRIAQLIGNLAEDRTRFLDHPSLDEMAQRRVDHIVIVDDFSGSGSRIAGFIDHIYAHRTIKSWISSRSVNLFAIAFSATASAQRRIEGLRPKTTLLMHRSCPTFIDVGWDAGEQAEVTQLCKSIGKLVHAEPWALGYNDTKSLMVFEYGCPNNVPAMLWKSRGAYHAIFPRRQIPLDLLPAFAAPSKADNTNARLRRLRQPNLAKVAQLLQRDALSTTLFLAVVAKRARRSVRFYENVSVFSGLSIAECRLLRAKCLEWKLIDHRNHLTEAGYAALARLRKENQIQSREFDKTLRPYYPKALKGP